MGRSASSGLRALGILERTAARGAVAFDAGQADARWEEWKRAPWFRDGIEPWLQAMDLTQTEFRRALGYQEEVLLATGLDGAERQGWVSAFQELVSGDADDTSARSGPASTGAGLTVLFRSMVDRTAGRLTKSLRDLLLAYGEDATNIEKVVAEEAGRVELQLLGVALRTLTLELNVARVRGELSGGDPGARFASYLRLLQGTAARHALFDEYPVLARLLAQRIRSWERNVIALIQRFLADRKALEEAFPDCLQGPLTLVQGGLGDRHRGGQTVHLLGFGSDSHLIYKPRSLATDVHFASLLRWLENAGLLLDMRHPRVLDAETYGWSEYVRAGPCGDEAGVDRYYRRQGQLLALLHVLAANDFHFENVIAAGEYPVLIDTEALFHGIGREREVKPFRSEGDVSLANSVLVVGLLPFRIGGGGGVDLSGLGGLEGQATEPSPVLESEGTDEMRMVRKPGTLRGAENLPVFGGWARHVGDYIEVLVEGFTATYNLLRRHRGELTAAGGLLKAFAEDEVRYIARSTDVYAKKLWESRHPNLLRDAVDRDGFLSSLWSEVATRPVLRPLARSEFLDLTADDVPVFTSTPSSLDLWDSRGQRQSDFFAETGIDLATRRLHGLSSRDRRRQEWVIRASMGSASGVGRLPRVALEFADDGQGAADPLELVNEARRIADELIDLAEEGGSRAWLGLTDASKQSWMIRPLGPGLYDGLPGLALFLLHAASLSGAQRLHDAGRECLEVVERVVDLAALQAAPAGSVPVGVFGGAGGAIYALGHLALVTPGGSEAQRCEDLAAALAPHVTADEHLDIVAGSAGLGVVAARLAAALGSDVLRDLAHLCAERLLTAVEYEEDVAVWRTPGSEQQALAGMAHGNAGFAFSLEIMAALLDEPDLLEVADAALRWERDQYLPDKGNWRDLRAPLTGGESAHDPMVGWCHGAAGIGLARLATGRMDPARADEIAAALRTTTRRGVTNNHSLCHGTLGNLELLRRASSPGSTEVLALSGAIFRQGRAHGWREGTPVDVRTPGLMTGSAGVGYGLLRAASPGAVPDVLTLEVRPDESPSTAGARRCSLLSEP